MSSFINERSIEYVVMYDLYQVLKETFDNIIPFYYRKNREGTNVSKECFKEKKVKLLAIFTRRPKLDSAYSRHFTIKFNVELYQKIQILYKLGIPTVACAALGSSFEEINFKSLKKWYRLDINENYTDYYIDFDKTDFIDLNYQNNTLNQNRNILIQAASEAEEITWLEAIKRLNDWKRILNDRYTYYEGYNEKWVRGIRIMNTGYMPAFVALY